MSMSRNILATYTSQIYATLVGLITLPIFVRYMGIEAYGLVGFFAMLQAWFQLLDMGLSPAMARETARHQGCANVCAADLRQLLRSLESIFLGVALVGAVCLIFGADQIAERWLKIDQMSTKEAANAIGIMALIIVLRWIGELYRGVITGFERLAWLAGVNAAMATVRFVLVIPFLIWVGSSAEEFFFFQLCVAVIETMLLIHKAYILLPAARPGIVCWSWAPLKKVMNFSLVMALAALVWVSVSQIDKLLLSGLLSLADYGRFSLAVSAAGGVLMLAAPIAVVLMPRLTALHARGDQTALLTLYRHGTQWAGLLAWPACAVLASHAERVLWIWTGDADLAFRAAPILYLYALGNGLLAAGAFPYYLQFAKGQLRLHLLGTFLFVLALLPSMYWAAKGYGAEGAGWAWMAVNVIYFFIWVPVAHAKHAPGVHAAWLFHDVGPIAAVAFAAALASRWLPWPDGRLMAGLQLLVISASVLIASTMGSSWARALLTRYRSAHQLARHA